MKSKLIRVTEQNYEALIKLGTMADTFDQVIRRLIERNITEGTGSTNHPTGDPTGPFNPKGDKNQVQKGKDRPAQSPGEPTTTDPSNQDKSPSPSEITKECEQP